MTFPTWPTRPRSRRGAVLASPVVLLSVVAVILAAVAFVATRGDEAAERDISATTAAAEPTTTAAEGSEAPDAGDPATASPTADPTPTPKPVDRSAFSVVVFNNTAISGLAGRVSGTVEKAGWSVVAADNWYGTVPATTVYFPQGKKAAARLLALDLGVARIKPADTDSDMSTQHLTLILTGELD